MKKRNKTAFFDSQVDSALERAKLILCFVMIWGMLAHGFMLFNKFSFHDDPTMLFGSGFLGFLNLGRWMTDFLEIINQFLFLYDYSLPVINGISFFLCEAAILWIISEIFEIKNKGILIGLSGLIVALPTVTCLFGYIHFAGLYGFGLLLSIGGACLICVGGGISAILGVICFVCALGIYQIFFCTGICVFILYMIKETLEEKYDWKGFFRAGLRLLFLGIAVLLLYMGILKVCLTVFHVELSSYKNLDTMGVVPLGEYIRRLGNAYGAFFNPNAFVEDRPYPVSSAWLYGLILFLLAGCLVLVLSDTSRRNRRAAAQFVLLMILFPAAAELAFVLSGDCYSLNFFGHYFIYVLLAMLAARIYRMRGYRWALQAAVWTVLCLNVVFGKYSKTCYLKANLLCENAKSYCTVLITRIQSADGYAADLPVVFIEPRRKAVLNGVPEAFASVVTKPYGTSSIINAYSWTTFMIQWCGYNPTVLPQEDYVEREEVKNMPVYPDAGSIQIVDGAVVVKFAEPEH